MHYCIFSGGFINVRFQMALFLGEIIPDGVQWY